MPAPSSYVVYRIGLRKHLRHELHKAGIEVPDGDRTTPLCELTDTFHDGIEVTLKYVAVAPWTWMRLHDFEKLRQVCEDYDHVVPELQVDRVTDTIFLHDPFGIHELPYTVAFKITLQGRLWRKLYFLYTISKYWYRRTFTYRRLLTLRNPDQPTTDDIKRFRHVYRNDIDAEWALEWFVAIHLDMQRIDWEFSMAPFRLKPLFQPLSVDVEDVIELANYGLKAYYKLRKQKAFERDKLLFKKHFTALNGRLWQLYEWRHATGRPNFLLEQMNKMSSTNFQGVFDRLLTAEERSFTVKRSRGQGVCPRIRYDSA